MLARALRLGVERFTSRPDRAESRSKRGELIVAQPPEEVAELLAALLGHRPEHRQPGLGRDDEDDATVLMIVLTLDEVALLHPADDPRRARDGDIEQIR